MISRGSAWCTEAILMALIVLSPWAFGAVHPPFELWVAYGVAAVLVLWAVRLIADGQVRWVTGTTGLVAAGALYILFLLATWQNVGLPASVLNTLSPNTTRTFAALVPEQREQLVAASEPVVQPARWSAGNRLSLNPGGSYQFSVRLLAIAGLFVAVSSLASARTILLRVSIAGAIVGSALALFGLVQYFSSSPQQIYWYFQSNGGGFGPFISRNHYPFFANLALGLTTGLLLDRYARRDRGWFAWLTQDTWAMWLLAAMIFIMTSIVVCVSRGGFVAMVVALTVCVGTRYRRGQSMGTLLAVLTIVGGAAVLLTWVGFDLFASRLSTLVQSDQVREDGRWHLWSAALTTAARFPLFGSGGETFRYWETIVNQDANWNSSDQAAIRADNEFLDVWAEYGIGAMLALVAVAVAVLWHGFRLARRDGLAAGAFMALTAVVVHSCLDFGLRVPASAIFATIIAALLCSLPLKNSARSSSADSPRPEEAIPQSTASSGRIAGLGIAVTCLAVALFLVNEKRRYAAANRYQAAGLHALQERDFDKCVDHMSRSALLVPDDVQSQINVARTILLAAGATEDEQLKRARVSVALKHCVLARDLCPLAYEPHVWLAQHIELLQRGDTQLAYLTRAHQLHPSEADISFALGALLYDQQRFPEAWTSWRSSLTFSVKHLDTIMRRARTQLSPDECLAQLLPDDAMKIYEAASLAEARGQTEESHIYLQRVIQLLQAESDDSVQAAAEKKELAARVFEKLGQPEKAIDAYHKAISYRPEATEWRLAMAQLLVGQERYADALRELRTALVLEPDNQIAIGLRDRVVRLQKESKAIGQGH